MKNSVWTESTHLSQFNTLDGDKKTDVLIIGGGMCGILCAYFLQEKGIDYLLLEGSRICCGITKNTTAKITSHHGLIYDKIIRSGGQETAKKYLSANENALSEYKKLCSNIDCDFENKTAYTYSCTDSNIIEREINAVNSLGYNASFNDCTELPFKTKGAIAFSDQAQFNPLKFINALSKNLNVYENTFVRYIKDGTAFCDGGKISAKKIIIAAHFPFINHHGGYFLKLYQHRSYVSAFENAGKLDGMYVDENLKGMSFRAYKDLLLVGGGSHKTGKRGGTWTEINNFADKYYPHAKLRYEWATQDCMSLDSIAYIGKYSKNTPNLYVATGFNKWGMTTSMVAAKILCDMVCEKENEYADVFCPQRSMMKPQLLKNTFDAAAGLLMPVPKRCPHLGCALKWNKNEHTWDCPCHGSRFEKDGKLIDGPATEDLK